MRGTYGSWASQLGGGKIPPWGGGEALGRVCPFAWVVTYVNTPTPLLYCFSYGENTDFFTQEVT